MKKKVARVGSSDSSAAGEAENDFVINAHLAMMDIRDDEFISLAAKYALLEKLRDYADEMILFLPAKGSE